MATAARDPQLGPVIKAYMQARGLTTHEQVARVLGVERSLVSKYLSGARTCRDVGQLRRFAEAMGLPPESFGLRSATDVLDPVDEFAEWRLVRQALNQNRHALTAAAARLYWDPIRIEGTSCISRPGWLASAPVDLDAVRLEFTPDAEQPNLTGGEPESESWRPRRSDGSRFERYSQAVRSIARPTLFENRTSYRLLDVAFAGSAGRMEFGLTTYFDMVDVCEVLAHEAAAAWLARDPAVGLDLGRLPFRNRVGDLFDTSRRPVLPSINTLTIRRARDGDTFFLHRRGAQSVTLAAGLTHVIPAGVFQPAAIGPWNVAADFSLWRNMIREFFEEFLDAPEHDGSRGTSIDYSAEPYRALTEARCSGKVQAWCFGMGLDPLAPAGEILTTVVIDADVFDRLFAGLVTRNSEGEVYPSDIGAVGIRWTAENVRRVLNREPIAAAAAACIALTWKYRETLLP
ncbi:transcriptional regulator with XRE-family HTH domain [Nocardia transvalensis]|uniref:Transcriptional regulator with XRE-family HTH domain n=1 Tax=Nocardia transvalensis TaxID=37333 RepID=A0A7W9PBJ3_9NOCA|nr:helix-turn-helix transcriptional regulator [Nocardia transvalensis]MBB5912940.1 transcriptional regulator with XRE-family HTH domain [Nocardia transvalensis]